MFTGIIAEIARITSVVRSAGNFLITIDVAQLPADIKVGDSIAVDGVCLTVVDKTRNAFSAEAVQETVRRSTLGAYREGTAVNIEYALRLSDRLGGHLVQGHVDGIGTIQSLRELEGSALYTVMVPESISNFCIEKGSIAVDGISLTIAEMQGSNVVVSIIPHTKNATTLGNKVPGDKVNLEVDLIAKYVKKLIDVHHPPRGITEDFLKDAGFL